MSISGSAPSTSGAACWLELGYVGDDSYTEKREVSGDFVESFVINPGRHTYEAILHCDSKPIATRTFRTRDIKIGEVLVLSGHDQ